MTQLYLQIGGDIGAAWLAGALIGFERSFHGRAAGFRTLSLVAIASASAMMVAYAPKFAPGVFPPDASALDPGRMAQGVMTGVGFLGAGVVFKEGVNVQGLTTAATVWATAAIGLLFGLGEYVPGALATAAVLTTLLVLRWIEDYLPTRIYAWSVFRFRSDDAPNRDGLLALLKPYGVSFGEISYARSHDGAMLEFSGNVSAASDGGLDDLAASLRTLDNLVEFELSRISK